MQLFVCQFPAPTSFSTNPNTAMTDIRDKSPKHARKKHLPPVPQNEPLADEDVDDTELYCYRVTKVGNINIGELTPDLKRPEMPFYQAIETDQYIDITAPDSQPLRDLLGARFAFEVLPVSAPTAADYLHERQRNILLYGFAYADIKTRNQAQRDILNESYRRKLNTLLQREGTSEATHFTFRYAKTDQDNERRIAISAQVTFGHPDTVNQLKNRVIIIGNEEVIFGHVRDDTQTILLVKPPTIRPEFALRQHARKYLCDPRPVRVQIRRHNNGGYLDVLAQYSSSQDRTAAIVTLQRNNCPHKTWEDHLEQRAKPPDAQNTSK